jgi:metacaspase-1
MAKENKEPVATVVNTATIAQPATINPALIGTLYLPKKKLLTVGINDYAPVGAGGPDLNGCVADSYDIARTLLSMGYVPANNANLKMLLNAQATRANIMAGLGWLLRGARAGDLLVFHYSGHGSQVPDTNGDEIDGWDETICPHDFATAGMIKDDDLRNLFSKLPAGVNLEVLLDSCHSGTGTKDLGAPGEQVTIRYVPPMLDENTFIAQYLEEANKKTLPVKKFMSPVAGEKQLVIDPKLNHVLWAGCRSDQTSGEGSIGGGPVRGYFTYWFCYELRKRGKPVVRKDLDKYVCSHFGISQTPQLECTAISAAEKVFT